MTKYDPKWDGLWWDGYLPPLPTYTNKSNELLDILSRSMLGGVTLDLSCPCGQPEQTVWEKVVETVLCEICIFVVVATS